jgi:dTDP-4-dehydrorhamnose 3,5-epimerase
VQYKCTELYDPQDEVGIAYNDPALAIAWPVTDAVLSVRDQRHGTLQQLLERMGDGDKSRRPAPAEAIEPH